MTQPESFSSTLREFLAVLDRLGVPCQAVGGLAARAYGATRPLVDLDFYVPDADLASIAATLSHRVDRLPSRFPTGVVLIHHVSSVAEAERAWASYLGE